MPPPEDSLTWRVRLSEGDGDTAALYMATNCGRQKTYTVFRESLQLAALESVEIDVMCDTDGTMYPSPVGLDDGALDHLFRNETLRGSPVDLLVERSFNLDMNEEWAVTYARLREMRQRLARALDLVDSEIAATGQHLIDAPADDSLKH